MDQEDKKIYSGNDADRHVSSSVALDDEQRIKVLSPAMLVFKRFVRNRLAITGAVIIGFMFVFSFIGGWIMNLIGYGQSRIFTHYVDMSKDYAGASQNTEFKFTTVDGSEFPMIARSQFVLAVNTNDLAFISEGMQYSLERIGRDFYMVSGLREAAMAAFLGGEYVITLSEGVTDNSLAAAFARAIGDKAETFESGGIDYVLVKDKKSYRACVSEPIAIATMSIVDYDKPDSDTSFEFRYQAELAMNRLLDEGAQAGSFTAGGVGYDISIVDDVASIRTGGAVYAAISRYIVQAIDPDVFFTIDFKTKLKEAINEDAREFTFPDADGTQRTYGIERSNDQWTIKWMERTLVIMEYEAPSLAHWLGTDGNGMDLLTRIMYGGRVSLLIGFIVVVIETTLGVLLGGISGYFGKWLDNLIMRVVDIFNCIPSTPLIIILGAMMDELRVDPQLRMVYLMLVLGILGWPGIARLVRGQILSLREQEFMVAAEATGLSVNRRIFKHLVPNVIPQLIVMSTMSLGSVILIESVLSFLGLGVKFPFASWGNIINAVSNVHVLKNYIFVWIPAGLCILLTVLGFNFIGDGLRDAFDPKMKR